MEFVVGNVLFVLGHEIGHALISELGIPVVGREEDGADSFAALMAILSSDAYGGPRAAECCTGWFIQRPARPSRSVEMVYYDEHGMDLQRAYTSSA